MSFSPSPRAIRNANLAMTVVCALLVYPTIVYWQNSVLWVGLLSVWAVFISHYTAYLAARVEVREEKIQGDEKHQGAEQDEMLALLRELTNVRDSKAD